MGRPRGFDTETVLDRAAEVFLEHGFAAVGIDSLTEELGLSRSSIYGAFGSKQQLWLAALDRYRTLAIERIETSMTAEETSPLDAVIDLLRMTHTSLEAGGQGRCLVVGAACERGATDPATAARVRTQFATIDGLIGAALDRAVTRGEISAGTDVAGVASVVSTLVSGARVNAAVGDDDAIAQRALTYAEGILLGLRAI